MADFWSDLFNNLKTGFGTVIGIGGGTPQLPSRISPTGDNQARIITTKPASYGDFTFGLPKVTPRDQTARTTFSGPNLDDLLRQNQQLPSPVADLKLPTFDYSDIEALIGRLGSSGFDSAGAMADIRGAYRPALRSIKKQRARNEEKNKRDTKSVKELYNMLSRDMQQTKRNVGESYNKAQERDAKRYDASVADVNKRFDAQIAEQIAALQQQNAPEATISEVTNRLNTQRNDILNNLLQGNEASVSRSNTQERAQKDFYRAGAKGAKLERNDKVTSLIDALNDRFAQLDDSRNRLLAQRAGDTAQVRQQAAASRDNAAQAQLSALFQLRNLQRSDQMTAFEMMQKQSQQPKPLTQSQINQMNIPQRAQYTIQGLGLPPAGAQRLMDMFVSFMGSDGDLSSGQFFPEGTDRAVKMNVQTALQKMNAWADNNGLTSTEKQMLRSVILNTYR